MNIVKKISNRESREIYKFDNGMIIKVPRYKKTGVYFGAKDEVQKMGIKVFGNKKLFVTCDGKAVMNGFLAQEKPERELILSGNIKINSNNIDEFINLIKELLKNEK